SSTRWSGATTATRCRSRWTPIPGAPRMSMSPPTCGGPAPLGRSSATGARHSALRSELVHAAVSRLHPLDEKGDPARIAGPQREDVLVGGRVIPVPGGIEAGELEHHHGRVEIAFERVHPSAIHEEASAEGFERGIDAAQGVRELLAEGQ